MTMEFNVPVTHTVLKNDDIQRALSDTKQKQLCRILKEVRKFREFTARNPTPNYIVINADEPFAEEVAHILRKNDCWGIERGIHRYIDKETQFIRYAVQFTDDTFSINAIATFLEEYTVIISYKKPFAPVLRVEAEGHPGPIIEARVNDYIVQQDNGLFFTLDPHEFTTRHEKLPILKPQDFLDNSR